MNRDDQERAYAFQAAPRCSATSKRTKEPCGAPAVRGWSVCRFHGARGGRPPTTGLYTMEAKEDRRIFSELLRQSRLTLADIK